MSTYQNDGPAVNTIVTDRIQPSKKAKIDNVEGSIKLSDEMTMCGIFKNRNVSILLDSGSEISVLSGKLYEEIKTEVTLEPSIYAKIVAVNKTKTDIKGLIKDKIKIGNFEGNYVIQDANQDILLGRNFIRSFVKMIDIRNNTIELQQNSRQVFQAKINAFSNKNTRNSKIKTAEAKILSEVSINPDEEKIIKIYPSKNILASTLIFEPNEWVENFGITIKNQAVPGYLETIEIKARNTFNETKILQRNKKIGNLRKQQTLSINAMNALNSTRAKKQFSKSKKIDVIPPRSKSRKWRKQGKQSIPPYVNQNQEIDNVQNKSISRRNNKRNVHRNQMFNNRHHINRPESITRNQHYHVPPTLYDKEGLIFKNHEHHTSPTHGYIQNKYNSRQTK